MRSRHRFGDVVLFVADAFAALLKALGCVDETLPLRSGALFLLSTHRIVKLPVL